MVTLPSKTIAIFGATGGTGLAVLKFALQAGCTVNVLARTPSKLADFSAQYPNHLHVIKGDIRDISSIKETLVLNNKLVDVVVSGIGMVISRKGLGFTSTDPHICEEGTKLILTALSQIEEDNKIWFQAGGPQMVLLSTTGISDKGRDIPIAMVPLYHWILAVPHLDKKKMEKAVVNSGRKWILVRPSFLSDCASRGLENIRVSTETPEASNEKKISDDVAIGYTISREAVGLWIVEECVKRDASRWEGKLVTITY
jgi:hypothetical protein